MADENQISDLDLEDKVVVGEKVTWGNFSNIYQGTLTQDGITTKVAIKSLRAQGNANTEIKERLLKRLYREVLLWRKLQHPNVVPLLGYTAPLNKPPALISPWYINGNVIEYLRYHRDADRRALALDVLNGRDYLHSVPVAHGDLKGENVLIDHLGHASLCDFGMSQFIDDACRIAGFTTTSAGTGGTERFMSPELLQNVPKGISTDIWALGCLVVQILADILPYQYINARVAVMAAIMRGEPPITRKPDEIEGALWSYVKKCWSIKQHRRPQAVDLKNHMEAQLKHRTQSLWTFRVAPSFGDHPSFIKNIDEITKVAITEDMQAVLKAGVELQDWDQAIKEFNNSSLLMQRGEEHQNRDVYIYTNNDWDWPGGFHSVNPDASIGLSDQVDWWMNKAVVQEVQGWFEKLVNDSDVLEATQTDIGGVRKFVAKTGHAITKGHTIGQIYRERSTVEFGVLRYPQFHEPYFKLYCIKVFAWANCQGVPFKGNTNGIKGVFLKRIYRPNEDIIKKMRTEVIDQAVAEAEDLLMSDD